MVLAGLIFGFLVGVGLVAGLKYVMDKRSKSRIQKVTSLKDSLPEKKTDSFLASCSVNFDCGILENSGTFLIQDKALAASCVTFFFGVAEWKFTMEFNKSHARSNVSSRVEYCVV